MPQIHCLTCQCESKTVADRLRAWRWRKVAATGRPAFVFLYDSELQNLSAVKPENLMEIHAIVAPQRHLWADELLALLHPEHYSLPEDPPAERGAPSPATNAPLYGGLKPYPATTPWIDPLLDKPTLGSFGLGPPGSSGAGSDPEDPGPLGEDEWDPWPADWVPPSPATTPPGTFGAAEVPPGACGAGESGAGDGSDEV